MKKWIFLLVVCLLLSSCSTTLMGNNDEAPYETLPEFDLGKTPSVSAAYFAALNLIELGAYEEAYAILLPHKDKDEQLSDMAEHFTWLEDTLIRTDSYIDGQLMTTEKAIYDDRGKLVIKSELRDRCDRTISEDKTYVLTETWMYDMHVEQTKTEAPYYLTFTYNSKGTVLAITREPALTNHYNGVAIWGYTVNYTFNAEGKHIRDSGIDRLHYVDNTLRPKVVEFPFEGSYTYDDSGRLLRYERIYPDTEGGISWDTYTYDTDGNLLVHESRKEGDLFFDPEVLWESIVREYRYDTDGNLIFESTLIYRGQSAETAQRDYTQTVYAYENGRLMKQTQTFEGLDTINETVYIYGDLFAYIRYQEEVADDGS